MIGTVVAGKYRVERPLGAGGMGTVWVAIQEPLGREVALKQIGGRLDDDARVRFEREAKIVANLRCQHVVTLFDFGEHDGAPYIVFELLEGETLRGRLERGPLGIDEALGLARDVACGLRSAHDLGVVHRDLKPENVVLVRDKDRGARAKILDFGIATASSVRDRATAAGTVAGTAGYIAPEVVARNVSSEPSVDLYALGVIMFEMVTGRHPFEAPSPLALIAAHATQPAPNARALRPDVPAPLAALIGQLLAKDPIARPRDADAVVAAIDALRAGCAPTAAAHPLAQILGATAPLRLVERPSIAVQPFAATGGTEDDVLFAEGVSEDILDALSRFKHLFVVSRMSMVLPGARDTDPIRVGAALGVRYVVQGNVRRAGDRLRVSAKLVDVESGTQLWAERHDAVALDLFELQDLITQSVVSRVAGHVEAAHAERARKMPPHTLAAHDWLARGRYYHHRRTLDDNRRAREALDRAIELDPDYAHAHAWRACAYGQGLGMGLKPEREAAMKLNESLSRALALDDADAECHRMACEVAFLARDIVKAEHHHRRAIALNPNDARIVAQGGELSLYIGDLEEAASALTLAARLDPLSPRFYLRVLVRVRYLQDQLDEAWRLFRCVEEGEPNLLALGAAISALRAEDPSPLVARVRAALPDFSALSSIPPFTVPGRRERWLRGFTAAGLT